MDEPDPAIARRTHGNEDVRFAIESFNQVIANADTKAGLLGTALTVIAGLVVSNIATLVPTSRDSVLSWMALSLLAATLVSVCVAAAFLLQVLRPRLTVSDFSRYSWPDVATASLVDLLSLVDGDDRADGWRQAHTLARIAGSKFRAFSHALNWFVGAVALSGLWWMCGVLAA